VHPSGARYEVLVDAEIAELPDAVRKLSEVRPAHRHEPSPNEGLKLCIGERNNRLASVLGSLINLGLKPETCRVCLQIINREETLGEPLPEAEINAIWRSGVRTFTNNAKPEREKAPVRKAATTPYAWAK